MKGFLFFCLIALFPFAAAATSPIDSTEQKAIIQTIDQLFEGMLKGDSSMVRSAFDPSARMMTTFMNKKGEAVLKGGSVDDFAKAVGTPHDKAWVERIWSYKIEIDGTLASAWTEYTFYLGEEKLHCGVNAFHLFKSQEGWKIIHITDTRRRTDCKE